MWIIIIILYLYICVMIGCNLGISGTNFQRPKGLWNLVPFRVSGWKNLKGEIEKINWIWE